MQRFSTYAATQAGVRSPNALITVVLASDGVSLATLFSTNDPTTPTPLANPFHADVNGFYGFYARNGRYTVQESAGDVPISPAISFADQLLYDPFDQPVAQLPGNVIDIRAYGAKCDGVTDDTAAFRAALTALAAPNGGTLLLPANATILVSSFVEILSPNVEIRGGGHSTIVAQSVGSADLFRVHSNAGCVLRDFDITNQDAWVSGSAVLGAADADDLLLENVAITNYGDNLNLTSCTRPKIVQCSIVGANSGGQGFTFTGVTNWLIRDCSVFGLDTIINATAGSNNGLVDGLYGEASTNHVGSAFVVSASTGCRYRAITIAGADGFGGGFLISTNSHQTSIESLAWLTTPVTGAPINANGSNNLRVSSSFLSAIATGRDAIDLTNCTAAEIVGVSGTGALSFVNATTSPDLRIDDCYWTGAATNVVSLTGCTYWKIVDSSFESNFSGVTATQDSLYGLMDASQSIANTGTFAVGVELLGAKFCTIRASTFTGNNNGIHLENSDGATFPDFNQILGNYCYNNRQDGIYTQNHNMNAFVGNYCIGNGRHGIVINSGQQIDIEGNTCNCNGQTDATGCGIAVDTTSRPKIVGNSCHRQSHSGQTLGSQKYGILVTVASTTGIIDGNMVSGNVTANLQNNSGSMVVGSNQAT